MVLEDGYTLEGKAFAGKGEVYGEVVFNTSMLGYQEILTDPSYKGQIVTFTYPLIGNYGVNDEDVESHAIHAEGMIVREYCPYPSSWRSKGSLKDYLEANGKIGIEDIDTRALTRHIREKGAMKGVISTEDLDPLSLAAKVKEYPGLVGQDMVKHVTTDKSYVWNEGGKYNVVALDFGIKLNILRMLEGVDCRVTVLPASAKAGDILALDPDGIFLSNGPGDPMALDYVIEEVKKLLGKKTVFGICLGHQILGAAYGLKIYKMKFGHRGVNHPVRELETGRIEITAQNHGFCVEPPEDVCPSCTHYGGGLRVTHINLNDNTVEGMENPGLYSFSVQYHPEAAAGPHDSRYLFAKFRKMMDAFIESGRGKVEGDA